MSRTLGLPGLRLGNSNNELHSRPRERSERKGARDWIMHATAGIPQYFLQKELDIFGNYWLGCSRAYGDTTSFSKSIVVIFPVRTGEGQNSWFRRSTWDAITSLRAIIKQWQCRIWNRWWESQYWENTAPSVPLLGEERGLLMVIEVASKQSILLLGLFALFSFFQY